MKVGECLKGKKYLVVLDDIWKTQVWDEVRGAFPDDQNGSRILITSRMNEMAHYTGTMPPYHLPFLNKQESWELFSKKVFRGEECPSDLEPLGRSIVETCRGLPLAIVVLAGLVAKKEKSQREWLRIEEISWHLTQDKTEVMNILKLSYDSLPPRLKPCFLYFGIYPEDYEINARQLIKLWIAEGFIQPQETGIPNTTEPEDVADYFLDELVDRSLVQVAKRRSDGGVKTCRIHDLLLDLCISESRSGKFLEVCTEFNIDTLSNTNPRRLSLHCQPHYDTFALGKSCTRSFFIYSGKCPEYIQKSFKLARVLHFERETFSSLDSNLKRMIHLRYLKISGMYNFLASISCLWNLETLDLRAYKGIISREIWKLKRLRHLYLRGFLNFPEAKGERMENLQTLSIRGVEQNMIFMLNNDSFPRLRKLTLDKSKELRSLHQLSTLQSLKITLNSVDLPLASYSTAFPSHLTKITVKLGQSPEADSYFFTKTLGWLTNLQVLKLQQIEPIFPQSPLELHTGTGEFPQLQVFYMRGIFIRGWTLEEGAMPSLRHLVIDTCHHLRELPEQLWSLTTLQLVHVVKPYRDLAPSLENVELKNGCKLIIEK
ncbi:putative late blight resistance protein-like R1A-6 [Spatholobus suberectus]|nr:putative late blight resistance protein-like R1A-6 [Spatholobus suberectus]